MATGKPFEIEIGGAIVRCTDAKAAVSLLRELQNDKIARMRTPNMLGVTAKKALGDGPYRAGIDTLLAAHPDGLFADELVAKLGLESAKGLGGYMTGLRKQCRGAGLPEDSVITERRKNGHGWRNHIRLSERGSEVLRKLLGGLAV